MIFVLTACGGGPSVHASQDPLRNTPVDPSPATAAEAITLDYVASVCAFHAQPSCVASRAATCADGLVLSDPAVCQELLDSTALACPGAAEQLLAHADEVRACSAHLATLTCDHAPACASDGTALDATGPCAPVVAMVTAACEDLVDPE
jgi:hypothetical protein